MDNQLTITKQFSLVPTSFAEAMKFAELICNSDFVPKNLRGKPADIIICWQMGAEVGLNMFQSIQNIQIINGKAGIWGHAAMALVLNHPKYDGCEEFFEGEGDNKKAICRIKRKGEDWHQKSFSIAEAKKAALWGKPGPWTQYSDRMLQMRARGFALNDKFADALKGLITIEEARDYPINGNSSNLQKQEEMKIENVQIIENENNEIQKEEIKEINEISLLQILKNLIIKNNIEKITVNKWCKFFNINKIEEANDEILTKIIEGIYNKYGKL